MTEDNLYDGDSAKRPGQRDTEKVWSELEPEGLEDDLSDITITEAERDQLQARINELESAVKSHSGVDADEYDRIAADRAILQLQVSELEQNLALKSDIFNKNAKSMANRYTESLAENAGLKESNEKLAKEKSHLDHDNLVLHEVVSDEGKKLYDARMSAKKARKFSLAGWTSAVAASLVAGFVYFNGLDAVANEPAKLKVEYSEPVKVVPEPVFKYVGNRFVAEFGDEKYSMSLRKADEIMSEMEKSGKELSPAEMKKYFSDRASKELRIDE